MSSAAFFHRDPRELPFLHEQVKKVLALADSASRNLSIREDDDPGFMAAQFLYKQMQHTESILMLIPRRDAGLIARTMIDGLYQLLWTVQSPDERARLWRSYSVIHDWRLIRGRLREGIPVDPAEIRATEARLKVLGPLHQLKKPRPNSSDPYHRTWHGGVKLADRHFEIKHLLDKTLNVLLTHSWGILRPPEDLLWFTSDDPVVKLNYYNEYKYDFGGGWNNPGSEIMLPLSPRHLLFTHIGAPASPDGTVLPYKKAKFIRRFIAEHAHQMIFASTEDPQVRKLRPRKVNLEQVHYESEQWSNWHRGQTEAEREFGGSLDNEIGAHSPHEEPDSL